jgi:hypothetical protein
VPKTLLLLLRASAHLEAVPPQTADPLYFMFFFCLGFFLRFSFRGDVLVSCFSSLSSAPVAVFLFFFSFLR